MASRISRRLEYWKGGLFSHGGRVALVNACLSRIPIYICLYLESLRGSFLRESGLYLLWSRVGTGKVICVVVIAMMEE